MESKVFGMGRIESQYELENMPIWALNRNCKLYGYRVELWRYGYLRSVRSDYRQRNRLILHQEK